MREGKTVQRCSMREARKQNVGGWTFDSNETLAADTVAVFHPKRFPLVKNKVLASPQPVLCGSITQ
jgi:hypothetical protein